MELQQERPGLEMHAQTDSNNMSTCNHVSSMAVSPVLHTSPAGSDKSTGSANRGGSAACQPRPLQLSSWAGSPRVGGIYRHARPEGHRRATHLCVGALVHFVHRSVPVPQVPSKSLGAERRQDAAE